MLAATIASLEGCFDELLIADGRIERVEPYGLPDLSDFSTLDEASDGPLVGAHIAAHVWPSQSAKRTWLLQKAQSLGCDWLIQIDSDERLHGAGKLRGYLTSWQGDAFPIPFEVDPGKVLGATWKVLRTAAWVRTVAGGAYIEHANGIVYCVCPPDGGPLANHQYLPWISHHPEERPEGRRSIRLGVLEDSLEPPPFVPNLSTPGLSPLRLIASARMSTTPADATHACPECGTRYAGPGLCEQGHPPAEVVALEPEAPAGDEAGDGSEETTETSEEPTVLAPPVAVAGELGEEVAPAAEDPVAAPSALEAAQKLRSDLDDLITLLGG